MAKTLTSSNIVLGLRIRGLYPITQILQGYAVDDIFDTDNISSAEVVMGVDGRMSGGYVPQPIPMNITLQGDSDSVAIFEQWYQTERTNREVFYADGDIAIPSLQKKYSMRKGILTGYPPTPSAKRIIQPRRFTITWESVTSGQN